MTLPSIIAAVCTDKNKIASSGVFVYVAKDTNELEEVSFLISKSMKAICHKISDEVYIIAQH